MTYATLNGSADAIPETRTPVRLPDRRPAQLFPGWGPKF
jgi:hypothetical protein